MSVSCAVGLSLVDDEVVEVVAVRKKLVPLLFAITLLGVLPVAADESLKPHQLDLPSRIGKSPVTLWVRDGFSIDLFANVPGTPRIIAEAPSGEFVVSQMWEGRVLKLADRDDDGYAEEVAPLLTGLKMAHGLAFAGDALYVAETHRIWQLEPWDDPSSAREIIQLPSSADIPDNPNHQTRSLAVGPDDKLYVSIGSFCDACVEANPMRGAIWRYNLDGSGGEPYATGLRNAVGMTFEPGTGRLWVTENGSNDLGDDLPPDEINIVPRGGLDFGWPFCNGARTVQPPLGSPERCAGTEPAALNLAAHIAPLGLAFVSGDLFPDEYHGDLFVAFHGSALLDDLIGYSVVRVPVRDGTPQEPVEFVRGWLVENDSWGRPMMPLFARDGSLLITDDKAGVVYRVRPEE